MNSNNVCPGTQAPGNLPLVSVVIPCFNHARYLPEAVASAAAQTHTNLEILIVNDGSTDDTSRVARGLIEKYPDLAVRLIEQENQGLPAARNAGINASTGEYWLPLDADDKIAPAFVERCLKALEHQPEAGFAYTDIQHFGDLDTVFRLPAFDAEAMVHRNNIGCVCSLVRRTVWEAVGGYDPCMRQGYEDWDFWVGCIEKGWHGIRLPDPLFFYRKRGGSMLAGARKKHAALFARIVLNHPSIYSVAEIEHAARVIRERMEGDVPANPAGGGAANLAGRHRLTVTYLIHSILGVTGGNQTLIRQANALCGRGHRVNIVTYSETPAWFKLDARVIRVPAGEPLAGFVPESDAVIATYFLNAPELLDITAPVRIYFAQGDQYVFADDTPLADPAAQAERDRLRRLCAESYQIDGIRFVANSWNLAATVQYRYGRCADGVIPACKDETVFKPMDRQTPPPWRILVVGPDSAGSALEPLTFKGIGEIRSALEMLEKRVDPFRVVRMSNTTADIFKGYPCEFFFKPADRKKTAIFGTAHILAYASHYDSCPYPPMEGMAAGAAVVCTATPGALEYCRHEENCLLVPVGDPTAIAAAMERIMHNPSLTEKIVAGGLATAARYRRAREWDELEDLLYRFLDGAGEKTGGPGRKNLPDRPDTEKKTPETETSGPASPEGGAVPKSENGQEEIHMEEQHLSTGAGIDQAYAGIQSLMDNERFDAAVAALLRWLADHPNHADAHGDLARIHYRLGESDKALVHYEKAVALDPENPVHQRNLADFLHVEKQRGKEALAIYESLAAAHPDDVDVHLLAGHLNVSLERFDAATAYYRNVLRAAPWHDEAARFLEAIESRRESVPEPLQAPAALHENAQAEVGRGDPEAIESRRESVPEPLQASKALYENAQAQIGRGDIAGAIRTLEQVVAETSDPAVAHNDLGVLLYQTGDAAGALAHYRKAAELAPDNRTFQKNLADYLYVAQGQVEEALAIYVKILASDPGDVETLLTTGHICVSQERFDDAGHFYRRVLEVEPWNSDAGKFLDALETHRKKMGPLLAGERLCQAEAAAEKGDKAEGIAILQALVADHPDHAEAHSRLGEWLYETGDAGQAGVHHETAARLAPADGAIQRRLADFYHVAQGQVEKALAIYETLAAASPEALDLYLMAGHLNVSLENFDAAAACYRHVLALDPGHGEAGQFLDAIERRNSAHAGPTPEAQYEKGLAQAEAGNESGAIEILEQLVARQPDHAVAHNDLGVLHYRSNDLEKSQTHYERAVSLDPANPTFQKNLADFYWMAMGDVEKGLQVYVNLLGADPFDVEALLATARICMDLSMDADAEHFIHRALEAEPWSTDARQLLDALKDGPPADLPPSSVAMTDSPEALYEKGLAEAEAGNEAGAIKTLEQLAAGQPDHAVAHNDLGVLYYRSNDLEKAKTHYERAASLDPANPTFQKNLADFYCGAMGMVEEGLEIYVNLLAADPFDVEALLATGQICMQASMNQDAEHFFNRALEAEPWSADARQLLDALEGNPEAAAG